MWIDCQTNKSIKAIAEHYKAVYMGEWPIMNSRGHYTNIFVYVFYQPVLKNHKHSHYFGIFKDVDGHVMICDAQSFKAKPIECLIDPNTGEVIVSKYGHDFRMDSAGNYIDGGREYVRVGGNPIPKTFKLDVVDDKFLIDGKEVEKRYE